MIQIKNKFCLQPGVAKIIQVGRTIMNVCMVPCKRQPVRLNAIMWQDQSGVSCVADCAQQIHADYGRRGIERDAQYINN